jgi:hypothetical protein
MYSKKKATKLKRFTPKIGNYSEQPQGCAAYIRIFSSLDIRIFQPKVFLQKTLG